MTSIIIATHNQGKLTEFQHLLAGKNWRVVSSLDLNMGEVEETGFTFVENALLKARYAAQESGLPAIGDDSGLVVEALNGAPGIFSARYAGEPANSQQNIQKLLTALTDFPEVQQRHAHFLCTLVYLRDAQDPDPIICQGRWYGYILSSPQGMQGFGYDPIFYVPSHNCSAAELDPALKNQLSHRGQALQLLLKALGRDES